MGALYLVKNFRTKFSLDLHILRSHELSFLGNRSVHICGESSDTTTPNLKKKKKQQNFMDIVGLANR